MTQPVDAVGDREAPRAAAAPARGSVSIALVLTVALVVVVTVLLGAFAAVVYGHEASRHAEELRAKARGVAEQQASSLSLPLWNLDARQQLAIMQSALGDRDVQAIVTTSGRETVVQARSDAGAEPGAGTSPAAGTIVEERDIEYRGERVGRVRVHVTPQWRDAELAERRDTTLGMILLLDLTLVVALYLLLEKLMLAPVRELQRYAASVQAGTGAAAPADRGVRFVGELRWLQRSISAMTAMLDARYRALRDSEQRLQLATRATQLGVWDWDIVNDRLVWDDRTYRLYGLRRDDFGGAYEAWVRCVRPEQRAHTEAAVRAALAGEREFATEFEIVRPDDGSTRVIRGEASTVRDENGRAVRMVGVNFDVTERRRAEAEIRELNADLERRVRERTLQLEAANAELALSRDAAESATRAKDEFVANMSHEIRTPMNAVLGMLDLALRGETNPRQQAYLGKAKAAAGSLLGIINDILDFSKIEAGKLEIEAREFALQDVLDRVTAIIGLRAREKRLELLIDTAADVPERLVGDSLRLEQVLVNLCSNAVKFTERGEVVLSTALAEAPRGGGVRLRFVVRDTGVGIEPAKLSSLFKPFSQLDASTTRRYGGTGLGLAICAKLVALMSGEIGVESRPGHGSEFRFTASFGRSGEAPWPQQAAAAPPQRANVLVVDDSASARDIFESLLGSLGHRAAAVAGAAEALVEIERAARTAPYDVVLLDWRMPEVDGFEAAERIRALELPAGTPRLILVSAWGDEAVSRRAVDARLDGCLAKPVSAPALAGAIATALRWRTAPPDVVAAAERVPAVLRGRRVLLVEDNEFNRIVAIEWLREVAGMHVTSAANGREALLALAHERFDVVLMDVQMPVMDGYEATALLRRDPAHAHVPVIAMTAHAMAGDRERCLAAGMDDYVSKPIDPAKLLDVLARWADPARGPAAVVPGAPSPPDEHVSFERGVAGCLGKRDLYAQIVERVLAEHPDSGTAAQAAFDEGDLARLSAVAHSMTATAGVVGAPALVDAARSLQLAADGADVAALPARLREFVRLHALALEELRGFLAVER